MPICNRCGYMAASADMRKASKGGAFCKDKEACKKRQKEKK